MIDDSNYTIEGAREMDKEYESPKPVKWADKAMFQAEPQEWTEGLGVLPTVTLLRMTHDPMGAVAAMSEMYKGIVVRNTDALSDDVRMQAFIDVQATHLQAPLEAIDLHFMIEGVDRAFTHQIVRQRTAVYAQESMRFAVVEDLAHAVTLPPSLHNVNDDHPMKVIWDQCIQNIADAYGALVNAGMPQEDARGLFPHAVATRLNYKTNLRNLVEHAGNRLCTQAQFHWRLVFAQIVMSIREYGLRYDPDNSWQYDMIAGSNLFRPKCYQVGHCPFKATFDRACKIRDRVDRFADRGISSTEWDCDVVRNGVLFKAIHQGEWLMDPAAARER